MGSLSSYLKKKCFLFDDDLHVFSGRHPFNSWEGGVRSVRCSWTAQQHGVLQVGVFQNVTHLEIHGVEQWTLQTSQASINGEAPLRHRGVENTQTMSTLAGISFCPRLLCQNFLPPFSISGPFVTSWPQYMHPDSRLKPGLNSSPLIKKCEQGN